jgi:hypothetical protein
LLRIPPAAVPGSMPEPRTGDSRAQPIPSRHRIAGAQAPVSATGRLTDALWPSSVA